MGGSLATLIAESICGRFMQRIEHKSPNLVRVKRVRFKNDCLAAALEKKSNNDSYVKNKKSIRELKNTAHLVQRTTVSRYTEKERIKSTTEGSRASGIGS